MIDHSLVIFNDLHTVLIKSLISPSAIVLFADLVQCLADFIRVVTAGQFQGQRRNPGGIVGSLTPMTSSRSEDIEKIGAGHIDTSVNGITGYLGYFPVELFVDI
ncbi:MAG: hypothetical protein P8Y40_03745 [Desulfobacterales bacterium]